MNLQEPLKFSSVNLDKIVYPKQRTSNNKKIILIKLNEKNKFKNLVFQTPTLLCVNKPVLYDGYSMVDIALVGKETNKVAKFMKFLDDFENKIKQDAMENAYSWFNIKDDMSINFQKIARDCDDYDNGILKIKLIKNNDFETVLQLNNNKRINVNNVPENSWCKMILEAYAIWVNSNNDFGIFFRPILVSFTPKELEIYNYKFIEDSEEDRDDFDIPDTDIKPATKDNIFMNIPPSVNNNINNDTTSQLEINTLLQNLNPINTNHSDTNHSDTNHSDTNHSDTNHSDTNHSDVDTEPTIVKIDLSDANLTSSTSSDMSEDSSEII
jgi:hypothetical protein